MRQTGLNVYPTMSIQCPIEMIEEFITLSTVTYSHQQTLLQAMEIAEPGNRNEENLTKTCSYRKNGIPHSMTTKKDTYLEC